MKYLILGIFLLIFNCNSSIFHTTSVPDAKNGVLDLTTYNPITDGVVTLDGEWEFYWNELLTPEDFKDPNFSRTPLLLQVPGSWNGTKINDAELSGEGYATYRLKIKLPPKIDKLLALKLNYAATSQKTWLNGKFLNEDGKVGKTKSEMSPHYMNHIRTFEAQEEIELIVQCSNFYHKKGGLWQSIQLGTEEDIYRILGNSLFYDFFLFGVLAIMTIYHFGLFILRKEEWTYLFFGLFCFILGVRILFTGETWITTFVKNINWNIQVKIEYITFYLSTPIFASFVYYLYKKEFHKNMLIAANIIGFGFMSLVLFTSPAYFTKSLPLFQLFTLFFGSYCAYALLLAIKRNRIGATAAFVGWLLFFFAIIGDIVINEIYGSSYLTPFGFFFFIFSQSFILSLIFSKTFHDTKLLSIHLKSTNLAYSRFVPSDFITHLNREDITQVLLGDQTKTEMTVLFCDIRKFTELSETMTPEQNFRFLNAYLKRVGPIIRNNNGFIDKFMGDGIMALFPLNPEDSVQAAIQIQDAVKEYNKNRSSSGYAPIKIGIGIHIGDLMLGTIGESNRMDATVISDAVNLASRLEGLTKVYGAPILISDVTFMRISDQDKYNYRMLGKVQVKGKKQSVGIIEIIHDLSEKQTDLKVKTKNIFERGIFDYLQKDFDSASIAFKKILESNSEDLAAKFLLSRTEQYRNQKVAEDWDGVEIFDNKF